MGYGSLCTDFYVNQKLGLKMDLPSSRAHVLDMFDRIRKQLPHMDRLRRFEEEVALESPDVDSHYSWVALRGTALRSGSVNPASVHDAYRLHKLILEVAPYYLSISPLDVEYLELVYGFDMRARSNRNEIVFDALLGDSPLAALVGESGEAVLDAQPFLGISLNDACDLQAFVEIKTRTGSEEVAAGRYEDEPISIYLTVRKFGPLASIDDFVGIFGTLAGHIERIAEDRIIPGIVVPIHRAIAGR